MSKATDSVLALARMHAEQRRQDDAEAEAAYMLARNRPIKPRIVAKDIFMDIEIDTVPRRWRTWVSDPYWVNDIDDKRKGGYVSGDATDEPVE